MAVPGICVLCLADICASEVHPVFNPVAPYGYLSHNIYLLKAVQTRLFEVVGHGLVSTSPAFVRSSASHLSGPHVRMHKNGKSGPHCWEREDSTQFAPQFVTAVKIPPCRMRRLEPPEPLHQSHGLI